MTCRVKGARVRYEMVAEAYRDLEAATGRLALIDRLAKLFEQTPTELLPTVCYLCQGPGGRPGHRHHRRPGARRRTGDRRPGPDRRTAPGRHCRVAAG
jgi:hypothetical protein